MLDDLLIIIIRLIIHNVEEAKFIDALRGADDAQPVAELLFFEEFFGPVHRKDQWGFVREYGRTMVLLV